MEARPDIPATVQGRPGSRRRVIVDALRAAGGAFVSTADIARATYGQADARTVGCVRSLINEARAGLRLLGLPFAIVTAGRGDALTYAWREAAPAPAAPPSAPVVAEDAPDGPKKLRISLAPLGTVYDGDHVIGADGVRWERARP